MKQAPKSPKKAPRDSVNKRAISNARNMQSQADVATFDFALFKKCKVQGITTARYRPRKLGCPIVDTALKESAPTAWKIP